MAVVLKEKIQIDAEEGVSSRQGCCSSRPVGHHTSLASVPFLLVIMSTAREGQCLLHSLSISTTHLIKRQNSRRTEHVCMFHSSRLISHHPLLGGSDDGLATVILCSSQQARQCCRIKISGGQFSPMGSTSSPAVSVTDPVTL